MDFSKDFLDEHFGTGTPDFTEGTPPKDGKTDENTLPSCCNYHIVKWCRERLLEGKPLVNGELKAFMDSTGELLEEAKAAKAEVEKSDDVVVYEDENIKVIDGNALLIRGLAKAVAMDLQRQRENEDRAKPGVYPVPDGVLIVGHDTIGGHDTTITLEPMSAMALAGAIRGWAEGGPTLTAVFDAVREMEGERAVKAREAGGDVERAFYGEPPETTEPTEPESE